MIRRMLALCLFAMTGICGTRGAAETSPTDSPRRPNFIIITCDDLGYADIGPFGSELNRTPALDRMATEGRKLTSFYAAPVCSPSRAALLTGCYPKRCLPIPHVLFPGDPMGLHDAEVTLAEVLKPLGYATAIIGKWHLGDQAAFLPKRQGFDLHFGLPYSNDMGPAADGVKSSLHAPLPVPAAGAVEQPPLPLLRNTQIIRRVRPDDQQSLVELYTREAQRFMQEHHHGPFLLYLPHNAVHWPHYPGKKWAGRSPHGLYSDWVEEVDWSVGEILNTLRDLKLAEHTLVIFTSDNGGTPPAINRPWRGFKTSTWEGGMRVPTIAWWPGRVPANTTSDAITGMYDLLPTCAELSGAAVPADRRLDGASIVGELTADEHRPPAHDTFYYFRGLRLEGVRHHQWKLRLVPAEPAPAAAAAAARFAPLLYNLQADPGETRNIAAEHPEIVEQLQQRVRAMDADLGSDGLGPGCRPLGRVTVAYPILNAAGQPAPEFELVPE